MKIRLLGMCVVLAISPLSMAGGGVHFGPSGLSVLSTAASGMVVLSPVWLPFYGAKRGSENVGRQSDRRQHEKEQKAKEKDTQEKWAKIGIPDDAVAIDVVDKHGKPQTLYLPEALVDKVDIKNGDRVDLEADENGVLLYKNGQKAHYFMLPENMHKLEQHPLNGGQ